MKVRNFEKIQNISLIFPTLSTLIIFPIMMDPVNLPKFFVLLVGSSFLLYLIIQNKFTPSRELSKNFLYLVLTYLLLLGIAGLLSQQSLFATLTGTWGRNNGIITSIIFGFFFLIFANAHFKDVGRRILQIIFSLGLFTSFYAWIQFFDKDPIQYFYPWYNKNDAIIATLGNSNFTSVFLAMTFSVSLLLFLQNTKFNFLLFLTIVSLLLHITLIPKLDTQGKISYGVGLVVIVGLLSIKSQRKILRVFGLLWWLISLVVGFFGLLGLSGNGVFGSVLSDNIRSLTDRYYAWLAAINMMRDSPLFGKGIDSFNFYYRYYRDPNASEIINGQPLVGYDNAHNTYLQLGATAGVPALVLYLALIISITWRAFVALQKHKNRPDIVGLIAIWVIYLLQSMVSMDQIGIAIWAWVCAGALVSISYRTSEEITTQKPIKNSYDAIPKIKPLSLFFIALIISIPSLYYLPVLHNESALFFAIRDIPLIVDDDKKAENLKRVVSEGYKSKQLELRLTTIRYLGAGKAMDEALLLAEFSANEEPRSFAAWHLVAGIYEVTGNYRQAIPAREKTIELDPHNVIVKKLLESDKLER